MNSKLATDFTVDNSLFSVSAAQIRKQDEALAEYKFRFVLWT